MDEFEQNERLTKSYLLGELGEAEREQFEEQFFHDPELREVALLVEDELVEDYSAGTLGAQEREQFLRHYLTTPHQMHKLEMTKALNEYVDRHPSIEPDLTPDLPSEPVERREGLLTQRPSRRRIFRLALARVLGLCIVTVGGVLLWQYISRAILLWRLQELNATNTISGRNSGQALGVTLSPERSRGMGRAVQEIVVPEDVGFVRLTLTSVPEGYDQFNVEVRPLDGREVFTISSVRLEGDAGARHVSINIPPELLKRGDYLLKLISIKTPEQSQEVADYFLRVSAK